MLHVNIVRTYLMIAMINGEKGNKSHFIQNTLSIIYRPQMSTQYIIVHTHGLKYNWTIYSVVFRMNNSKEKYIIM